MDQSDVAATLAEIAALLELKGESRFRVRAYQTAARAIAGHPGDLLSARRRGALAELRGLGPVTADIVGELLDTGRCRMLEDLRDQVAPGLADMLQLPGLGVARIRQIHESLHVDSLIDLADAARDGRLARLPRFGPRTAERILRGIAFLQHQAGALLVHHACREAETFVAALRGLPGIERVEIAGSIRRCCELVRDLDVVLVGTRPASALVDNVRRLAGVLEISHDDAVSMRVRLDDGPSADLYVTTRPQAGFALLRATGSSAHLALLAARAAERGLTWQDDGLHGPAGVLLADSEEAVYADLDLAWIPPELREGGSEVTAAAAASLPQLVARGDLQGFLHCHSSYSDGSGGMKEWITAAGDAGYRYVGITDHSPATAFGSGLAEADIARQHREIDTANATATHCRLLKGVEADILASGELDYTPALRRGFDFIIASVHSRHGMDEDAMTARVLRAMDDPTMTILGHPTGRLLLSREAYPMDLGRIFARAAERHIAIEINADPQRLDLDWRVLQRAVAAGVVISIGADAHGPAHLHNIDYGLGIARKGWLRAEDILNTRPVDEFLAFAQERRV